MGKQLQEELVQCRVDHYQTPGQVRVSIFAKQVDKERSKVLFEEEQVTTGYLFFLNSVSYRCAGTFRLLPPWAEAMHTYLEPLRAH